jgi:hypothetical protein
MIHLIYYSQYIPKGSSSCIQNAHQIIGLFKSDPDIKIYENIDISIIKNLIRTTKDTIFIYWTNTPEMPQLLNFISSQNILCKILFLTFDFWPHKDWGKNINHKNFVTNLFNAKNYSVITFADSIQQLNEMWDTSFERYKNHIIFRGLWYSYDKAFVEFNKTPINKIALSGNLSKVHYPERNMMSLLPPSMITILVYNKNELTNNGYTKRLNQYICCFASSVHVYHKRTNCYKNTHIILLKIFEILASGSLLLCPKSEEIYLKKLGLYSMVHYYLIDMENIHSMVEFILDIKNKEKIDSIRRDGQKYAKSTLNCENKYNEIKTILKTL